MATDEDKQIALEILHQLGGTGRLIMMTGAKHFLYSEKSVQFQIMSSAVFNAVKITLNWQDTYDIKFTKFRGVEILKTAEISDIYNDQLVEIFEKYTGCYLTFGKIERAS